MEFQGVSNGEKAPPPHAPNEETTITHLKPAGTPPWYHQQHPV